LKPKYDKLLSTFAFNSNIRRYDEVLRHPALAGVVHGGKGVGSQAGGSSRTIMCIGQPVKQEAVAVNENSRVKCPLITSVFMETAQNSPK